MPSKCDYCKSDWTTGATHCSNCGKKNKELAEAEILSTVCSIVAFLSIVIPLLIVEFLGKSKTSDFSETQLSILKFINDYFLYFLVGSVIGAIYFGIKVKKIKKEL